jgi:hypothetical protein
MRISVATVCKLAGQVRYENRAADNAALRERGPERTISGNRLIQIIMEFSIFLLDGLKQAMAFMVAYPN